MIAPIFLFFGSFGNYMLSINFRLGLDDGLPPYGRVVNLYILVDYSEVKLTKAEPTIGGINNGIGRHMPNLDDILLLSGMIGKNLANVTFSLGITYNGYYMASSSWK